MDFGKLAKLSIATGLLCAGAAFMQPAAHADPSKYPEFAQQQLPADIVPAFISVDELVEVVKSGTKPVIIDVRSDAEFKEAHILGAVSAPLGEFKEYLKSIPRDRPIVLY
jgi:rhodanese-like protein